MPRTVRPEFYAVRLRQSHGQYYRSIDITGFLDMLRYDGSRVVGHTISEREATWVVLTTTQHVEKRRWQSMGIPVIGPYSAEGDVRGAVSAHIRRLDEALEALGRCAWPGCQQSAQPGPYTGSTQYCPDHWQPADKAEAINQDEGIPHTHETYVEGCFRCELSHDEARA